MADVKFKNHFKLKEYIFLMQSSNALFRFGDTYALFGLISSSTFVLGFIFLNILASSSTEEIKIVEMRI